MPQKTVGETSQSNTPVALEAGEAALDVLAGFVTAIDRAPMVAIQSVDRHGVIQLWNDASATLFGIAREEALYRRLPALLAYQGLSRREFSALLRSIWDCGQPSVPRDWQITTRDGKQIWVYAVLFPVVQHGVTQQVFSMVVDITARKTAEQTLSATATEFRAFFEYSADAIILLKQGQFHDFNAAAMRLFGFTDKAGMAGMLPENMSPPLQPDGQASPEKMQQMTALALKNGNHRFEWLYRRQDQSEFWGEALLTAMPAADGDEVLYAVVRDITFRKNAERQLRLSAQVFENSHEAIMILGADWRIVSVNAAFTAMTGFETRHVLGAEAGLLKSERHGHAHYDAIRDELARCDHWQGEVWAQRRDGESFPAWASVSAVHNGGNRISNYIALFYDISERKAAEERIRHMVEHDFLTGLPNRVLLLDRLQQAMAAVRRHGGKVALLFLDLDHFKNINDTLGHHVGDKLLQAVAERLRGCVRGIDTVSRQGGDEFVVMLADIHEAAQVAHIADNILHAVSQPYQLEKYEFNITTCIGVALFPNDGDNIDTLIKNADIAMYHAKESGRNGYQFFNDDMNVKIIARITLENDLKRALLRGEFVLHYQPEVDIASGQVVAAEALLRWQHPQWGMVPPARFLAVAEECGMIVPIGDWVLRQACLQAKAWQEAGYPIAVSVNMSVLQFRQKNFILSVAAALELAELDPQYLEIEITESVLMDSTQSTIETMQVLRRMGIKLAIDDFGTGYSSLSYLRHFPIDKLKIDQSFVHDLKDDVGDAAIIRAILVMAKSLKLKVIAEGVETLDQLAFLQAQGCDEYQGYYLTQPMGASEVLQFRVAH